VRQLTLRAPSGARVEIGLPDDAPVASVAAGVRFVGGSYGTGFGIGPRGYHDFAARHVAPATPTDRLVVHGREVVVAEADDGQSSWATLLGPYHELMTVFAGPGPRRDRVLGLFGALRIEDHLDGMVVRPRRATLLDAMTEQVLVVVAGRGSLCVPGPRQAAAVTPRHAGAPTRHGEVWKAPYAGTDGTAAPAFLLGCPAGTAEVHFPGRAVGTRELAWLDGLSVAWHGTD
jgi:hypothetical protein